MRIHQIEVSNVLKIKDVTAKFDPHFQVVGGRNAQGKSSLIQAIWLALGGGNASKETVLPIRHGETKASVVLDLGDLIVTRSWTAKGTRLTVKTPEGAGFFWTPAFYGAWAALVACGVTLWGIRKHLRAGRIAAYNDMIHELDGKRLENVAMAFTHPVEARMYKHALDLIREEQWVTDVDDTVAQLENMGDE